MKIYRTPLRLALGMTLLSAPLTTACGKKEPVPEASADASAPSTPPAGASGEAKPEGSQHRRELEAAPETKTVAAPALPGPFATAGLYAVPKGAPFVAVGSIKKILDGLGYDALVAKYGALLGGMTQQMMQVTGKDFTQLAAWSEIGVDLASPSGVFMPELDKQALVVFVPLSDPAKLLAFVADITKKAELPLSSEKIGAATLFTAGERDRNAWLVKDGFFYSVNVMRGNGAAAIAKEIADRKEADSLVSSPELKAQLEGVVADEAGMFVQVRAIAEATAGARRDDLANSIAPLLEEAKKRGDAGEIARLEAAMKEEQAVIEKMNRRRAAEAELVTSIISTLSTATIGFDLSDDGLEAQVRLPVAPGGELVAFMRNASEPQLILKALGGAPLFLVSAQVEPQRFLALFEKMVAADGDADDFAEAKAQMKKELGFDLEQDVIAQLTGEIGFALTGDVATLMTAKDPRAAMGGTFVVGLKSEDGLKAIVSKLASLEGVSQFAKWDAATSTLSLSVPGMAPATLVFAGNRLIVSSDPETGARLAAGTSIAGTVANPKLKALLERKDLAGLMLLKQSFIATWLYASFGGDGWEPPARPGEPAAMKAKRAELAKLKEEIATLRTQVEQARMKPALELFDKLGTFAEAVTVTPDGLSSTIGLYTNGAKVPDLVMGAVELGLNASNPPAEPTADEKRLRELEDQRWKLQSELEQPMKAEEAVPPTGNE